MTFRHPFSGRHQDLQESRDAAGECRHGRLPHDTTTPCGCFPQETEIKAKRDRKRAKAKSRRRKAA